MRIAMLAWESLHSIAVGGVAQHVTELAAALRRQGHDVHVFTRIAPGQSDYTSKEGVHYYRCVYQGHQEFVDDVNNMCRAFVHRLFGVEDSTGQPFDIIHAHDWLTANAMIWIKKARPRRGIFTIHATEYARSGNLFHNGRSARVREQERAGTYWADHVIAVSHTTRKEVMWMYEAPEWKTSVVYNGVTRHRFDHPIDLGAVRRHHDIGPMDPTVLFCGRLDYQKGPDILLEAFPQVLNSYANAKLVFAGDGGMRQQLERRAQQLGVAPAVRFLGYRTGEEVVNIFKISDVVAIPSRNEPFGIVVLEAWCAAKPVLVTHNGGPSEYVTHGENGLRIYDNPHSVSWGIHQLFGDFERAHEMGANGRRTVDHGFTWDLVAEQTLCLYDPEGVFDSAAMVEVAEPATDHAGEPAQAPRAEPVAESTPEPTPEPAGAPEPEVQAGLAVSASVEAAPAPELPAEAAKATLQPTPATGEAPGSATMHKPPHDHAEERPVELELVLRMMGDHATADEQLRICEQVMDRWHCQARRHNGGLIVGGEDWQTLFDAVREACHSLYGNAAGPAPTRLIVVADVSSTDGRTPAPWNHEISTETEHHRLAHNGHGTETQEHDAVTRNGREPVAQICRRDPHASVAQANASAGAR